MPYYLPSTFITLEVNHLPTSITPEVTHLPSNTWSLNLVLYYAWNFTTPDLLIYLQIHSP